MRGVNKLNIEIVHGSPRIKIETHNNGKASVKHTTADSFAAAIAQNINFNTGVLPKGTRYFSGTVNNYKILIETAPMTKVLNLHSNARYDNEKGYKGHHEIVPFPHLLFHLAIVNGSITSSNTFALKKSLNTLQDRMYMFPYGNVYHNGNVCWGSALKNIKINTPMDTLKLIARFLDSQYNADLFDTHCVLRNKLEGFGENFNFWRFVEYMKDKKIFPVEALSPLEGVRLRDYL